MYIIYLSNTVFPRISSRGVFNLWVSWIVGGGGSKWGWVLEGGGAYKLFRNILKIFRNILGKNVHHIIRGPGTNLLFTCLRGGGWGFF